MRSAFLLLLVTAVVAAALSAGSARAATVEVFAGNVHAAPALSFQAARGEANDVSVHGPIAERHVVDRGAPLSAGDGCRQLSEHEVLCENAVELAFHLGGETDRLDAQVPVSVDGGPGNDELYGSTEGDTLRGGDGSDRVYAGAGNDLVQGDASEPAADVLEGGDGTDSLDYMDHPRGVTVDLADPTAASGADGERDTQTGFENVRAPDSGPSTLLGDDGPNDLFTFGPGSRLAGRGGADQIYAGGRNAVAEGGPGDDLLRSAPGTRADCGEGDDRVDPVNLAGLVGADCERLPFGFGGGSDPDLSPYPTIRGTRATFRIPCPPTEGTSCDGRVRLRTPAGAVVGTRRWSTRAGRTQAVGLTLPAGGGRLEVSIIATKRGDYGRATARYSIEPGGS